MIETDSVRVRLAFIGCGSHSSRTLQPNAHLVDEIELVAMCDLDEVRARGAAARWGVGAWYTDVDAMLANEEIDAVVVAGPPGMMQPIAKEMLGRGLHVFTEKPPALTSALALELVEASEASGAFGMVGTHWRHSPPNTKAMEIFRQEGFGEPNHCSGWFYAPGPVQALRAWGDLDALASYLFAQGVHLLDCTRALMGDIEEVSAAARATEEAFDSCSVSLRFANGATGVLSMASRAPYWFGHRVFGTGDGLVETQNNSELRAAVPPYWTGEARPDYQNMSFQTWTFSGNDPGHTGGGYLQELTHFATSILAGRQPAASLRDGYMAIRALEAIRESVRSGRPVSVV